MESIVCAFGANINAGTGFEQTMYMLNNVPVTREGIIDSSLLILFDWSAFVTNDPAEIDAERGVILEEKRTRDTYQWRQTLAVRKALFKGSALENVSLIGSEENLKNFKPESLVNYYKTWYRPDMQAIIVVGDVDADAVVGKIENLFGQLPKAENPKAKEPVVVPDNATPIVSIFTDKEMNSTGVMMAVKSPAIPAQFKGTGVALLNGIVEDLVSIMANERLGDISRKADAPFLGASLGFADVSNDVHALMADVSSKDGEAIPAFTALMTELERVKRYGFTPDEFDRAKTNILKRYETAMNYSRISQDPEAQYVMSYFTNMEDDNLIIFPTHRIITKWVEPYVLLEAVKKYFNLTDFTFVSENKDEVKKEFLAKLEEENKKQISIGLYMKNVNKYYLMTIKDGAVDEIDAPDVLKKLDLTALHELIITKELGYTKEEQMGQVGIKYIKQEFEAFDMIDKGSAEATFIMPYPKMDDIRAVSSAGYKMPQKSTYFYPKLLSGVVINPLWTQQK